MSRILITGAAGFVGMHTAIRLSADGHELLGIDNFNDYYDPTLKRARRRLIQSICPVHEMDICNQEELKRTVVDFSPSVIVHLAAQAGVRYSLENPEAYIQSNVLGHLSVLEACRAVQGKLSHLLYASSSSVYGGNSIVPFSEQHAVEQPVSLYAATKRSAELISSTYAHLYGIKQIGLRFFTVYGAWGRPDMAYWIFTDKIMKRQPIRVFNHGKMRRDFTHIDDIVSGVSAIAGRVPKFDAEHRPHRVYNIGNNNPVQLMDVINIIEREVGETAIKEFVDMQPGDVKETFASLDRIQEDYNFYPTTSIEDGLSRFVRWYKQFMDPSSLQNVRAIPQ